MREPQPHETRITSVSRWAGVCSLAALCSPVVAGGTLVEVGSTFGLSCGLGCECSSELAVELPSRPMPAESISAAAELKSEGARNH